MMPAQKNVLYTVLTAVFCVLCCVIPVCLYQSNPKLFSDVSYTLSESEIILPEVLYQSSEQAVEQLEALGLQVIFHEKVYHPVISENQVLVQNPCAGSILHSGDTVTLTLSDGCNIPVPDVRNLTLQTASEILEKSGFSVIQQSQSSDSTAPDTVISQSIAPDSKVAIGSTIELMISSGRENLDQTKLETVGNYVGMHFEDAKTILSERYLYALQADTAYYPDIPNNTIVSQDTPVGKQLPQGSVIRMTVSLGQEVAKVPDCMNLNANSARSLLEEAGFHCVIQYISDSNYSLDTILNQNAQAGSKLAVGSKIILTASVGNSNQVISTGGWSGNPLPTFTTETETDPDSELLPEETAPEFPDESLYETAPEPFIEPQEPENPDFPEITVPDPVMPDTPDDPDYQDAPETAPF